MDKSRTEFYLQKHMEIYKNKRKGSEGTLSKRIWALGIQKLHDMTLDLESRMGGNHNKPRDR